MRNKFLTLQRNLSFEKEQIMTEEEMVDRVDEILGYLWTDTKANTYTKLMLAAYSLWTFLHYDANCDFPPIEPIEKGYFEF